MKKLTKKVLSMALALTGVLTFGVASLIGGNGVTASAQKVSNNTFTIGAWISYYPESKKSIVDQTRDLAKSGMNLIDLPASTSDITSTGGAPALYKSNIAQYYQQLDAVCQEVNMYYFLAGSSPYDFATSYNEAKNLQNCIGYHIKDEPSSAQLEGLAQTFLEFYNGDPTRIPFVNLFPSYAGTANLGGTYKDYVEKWVSQVGAANMDLLYYDHYPFQAGSTGIRSTYFSDIETIRSVAYKNGKIRTGGFTQMGWWNGMRRPTVAEARWSMNTFVAYGFKSISHFCWVAPAYVAPENGGEGMHDFVLTASGDTTDLYEPMSILNWQTRQIGDILSNIDVQHAYHYGDIPSGVETLPSSFIVQPTSGSFIVSMAYSKDTNEPYVILMDKRLSGNTTNYTFNVDLGTGIDSVRYYKADDYTMTTLPNPSNLSTMHAPTEQVLNAKGGSFSLSFRPGDVKVLKLEGENGVNIYEELNKPECSHASGTYEGPQKVAFTTTDPGASIYYTLDGSYPEVGAEGTYLYQNALTIGAYGNTTYNTIRAMEVRGDEVGEVVDVDIMTIDTSRNVAFGKGGTFKSLDMSQTLTFYGWEAASANAKFLTDNSFDPRGNTLYTNTPSWAVVDFEEEFSINKVVFALWHDWTYTNVKIQIARNANFSDAFTVYEASSYQSVSGQGTVVDFSPLTARYIRLTCDSAGREGHGNLTMVTEIQAFSTQDASINVAQGRIAQVKNSAMTQNISYSGFNGSASDIKLLTDNSVHPEHSCISTSEVGWFVIDFGKEYLIDTVAFCLWHDWWFSNTKIQIARNANFSDAVTVVDYPNGRQCPGDFLEYVTFTPTTARYLRFTDNAKGEGWMLACEIQAYTYYNAGTELIADTSNWANVGGGAFTNNGSVIQEPEAYQTSNWNKGYSYNAKTFTNFLLKGSMKIDVNAGSGFAGFQIMRENKNITQGDANKGLIIGVQPNGDVILFTGSQTLASGGIAGYTPGSTFTYAIYVNKGQINVSINGKPVISYYSSSYANKAGYLSVHAGTLPITVYSVNITELGANDKFLERGTVIKSFAENKKAFNVGTSLSSVVSSLGNKISATDNKNNKFNLTVTWSCDNYSTTEKGKMYTFTGTLNAAERRSLNLSNAYGYVPTYLVWVKADVDLSTLQSYITLGDSLVQSDYAAGEGVVMGTWAYFVDKLGAAKDMTTDEFLTQSDIQVGVFQIKDAIEALTFIGDASALANAIAFAEGLNVQQYTSASYATYAQVLAQAKSYYAQSFKARVKINEYANYLNNKTGLVLFLDGLNFEMTSGASVRFISPFGIRFKASFDADKYLELIEDGYTLTFGMLIAPADYTATYGALTINNSAYPSGTNIVADTEKFVKIGDKFYYTCSLVNILEQNLTREFNAVGYVRVVKNTENRVIYAQQSENKRSIYQVTASAIMDTDKQYDASQTAQLNAVITNVENIFSFSKSGNNGTATVKNGVTLENIYIPHKYYDKSSGTFITVKTLAGTLGASVKKFVFGKDVENLNITATGNVSFYVENDNGDYSVRTNFNGSYTGDRNVYIAKNSNNAVLPLDLGINSVKTVKANGNTLSVTAVKNASNVTLNSVASFLNYGENIVEITDNRNTTYKFIVYKGVTAGEIAYYDFDINTWSSNSQYVVPNEIVSNGIDGKTLHSQKSSDGLTIFGFYPSGNSEGFASFTFKKSTEYILSFDVKVLSGTSSDWWCPMRFGNNGDVGYLYDDYSWQVAGSNVLFSQVTVTANGNGSYRFTSIFKTLANGKCTSLDIPNWGGACNVYIDNICIKPVNPDAVRVACVGDSITEAANTDYSYPEQLQNMLGYNDYYVFNFGKSASNAIKAGVYPYRTWAADLYNHLLTWNPDVIFFQLGTNDGRWDSGVEVYGERRFMDDYYELLVECKAIAKKVYINISPYAFGNEYGIHAAEVNNVVTGIQGYIAYTSNYDIIDVHAAVKACDRATYFPDYIHGNNAGYGVIARAVADGLTGTKTYVNRYHLAYALSHCNNKSSSAYNSALAVYNNQGATQAQINAAYDSISSMLVITKYPFISNNSYMEAGASSIKFSIDFGTSVEAAATKTFTAKLNGANVNCTAIVDNKGVAFGQNFMDLVKIGPNKVVLTGSDGSSYTFVFYYGIEWQKGVYYDFDVNSWSSDSTLIVSNSIENNGIDGKSIHYTKNEHEGVFFAFTAAGTTEDQIGCPRYDFEAGQRYYFSFDIKILSGTPDGWWTPIRFGNNGDVVYVKHTGTTVYLDMPGNNVLQSTSKIVNKGNGVYTVSAIFTTLSDGSCQTLTIPNWGAGCNVLMDNITLFKIGSNNVTL